MTPPAPLGWMNPFYLRFTTGSCAFIEIGSEGQDRVSRIRIGELLGGDMIRYRAEVGIVGARPADARAAELFAILGATVVMLDPKAPWEKPCGGGLTPRAFDEIPELEELKPLGRPVTSVRVEANPAHLFVKVNAIRRAYGAWHIETSSGDLTVPFLVAAPNFEVELAPAAPVRNSTAQVRTYATCACGYGVLHTGAKGCHEAVVAA